MKMKHFCKRAVCAALVCVLSLLLLASCSGGVSREEATQMTEDFLRALGTQDYAAAEALLHPERPLDLEKRFGVLQSESGLDFGEGIRIDKYTGFSSSYYDSSVGGSRYELTVVTTVGDRAVTFVIETVRNDAGYGIYNVDIKT